MTALEYLAWRRDWFRVVVVPGKVTGGGACVALVIDGYYSHDDMAKEAAARMADALGVQLTHGDADGGSQLGEELAAVVAGGKK